MGYLPIAVSSNNITASSNPFINSGADEYRIIGTVGTNLPRDKGMDLGLSNNVDPDDRIRGSDGAWDVGAYEFSGASASDTTPPIISITAPAAGATASGTAVTVSANASDNVGVVGVQFKLDGVNLGSEDTTAPYSVTWSTTTASNGSHTLTAVARDAAGNQTTSLAVAVTVSNVTSSTNFILNGTFEAFTSGKANNWTDANGGAVYILSQDTGHSGSAQLINLTVAGGWGMFYYQQPVLTLGQTYTWTFWYKTSGANTLAAEIVNGPHTQVVLSETLPGTNGAWQQYQRTFTYNNSSADMVRISADQVGSHWIDDMSLVQGTATTPPPDTTPPAVSITAPANNATVSGTITIAGTASDNVGVVGVQFVINGTNFSSEDTVSPYSKTWNTTVYANGTYSLTAIARDAAGYVTTSVPITVTVSNASPDTTPPTVSITAPANAATVSGVVTVSATASDNAEVVGVAFAADGVSITSEDTSSPYSVTWDTTGVPNGLHSLTATARDLAGNTTTATVTITVNNQTVVLPTDLTVTVCDGDQRCWTTTITLTKP